MKSKPHLLTWLVIVTVVLGLRPFSAQSASPDPVDAGAAGAFYSSVGVWHWTFVVSRKDIEDSPRWVNTDDYPPLPPGAAVRAARRLLPELLPDANMEQWHVRSVALQQILFPDAWIYVVELNGSGPCEL